MVKKVLILILCTELVAELIFPLTNLGVVHCKAAGDFLSNQNIGKIYYSSIPMAKQSVEYIAKKYKTQAEMVE